MALSLAQIRDRRGKATPGFCSQTGNYLKKPTTKKKPERLLRLELIEVAKNDQTRILR
jgi:hypothetical protein